MRKGLSMLSTVLALEAHLFPAMDWLLVENS